MECLAELENLNDGCERTIAALLDKRTLFDVFLMQVVERVLFLHGCRDPERIMPAMSRIYREGCPWFHQSVLYTSFHILRTIPNVEDSLLEEYKSLTRETIAEGRALFRHAERQVSAAEDHMGWAEIIFDQHRPAGKAQFIPQFYREALAMNDIEYARRTLRATGMLSHSYDRHDLALLALTSAAAPKPQLRETLVDLLANIRFYDEAAVDRFLEQHAGADLKTRVLAATPSIRSADTFNWIDTYVNTQMLASEKYQLQIAAAYRSAGTSTSVSQGMVRVLKHVLNMIAGREALKMDGNA